MSKFKKNTFLACSVLLAVGCANVPGFEQTQQSTPAPSSTFSIAGCPTAPERPINNTKKIIGTAAGAIGGALVGKSVGGRNSTLVGAGLGGIFGYLVGSQIAVKEQADGSVMLDVPGAALFDTNKTEIKPKFSETLERIASTLQDNPSTIVCVIGHTDNVGNDTFNENLSLRRAQSVTHFLAHQGIDQNRLTAKGLGESYPTASNETEQGRTQNRRVEIYVRN